MSETHTPGPWRYMGRSCSAQIRGPQDQIVAYVEWEHDPSWGKCNVQVETETTAANGRLIAAAPDLLAALQALVDVFVSDDAIDHALYAAEIRAADSALDKAVCYVKP